MNFLKNNSISSINGREKPKRIFNKTNIFNFFKTNFQNNKSKVSISLHKFQLYKNNPDSVGNKQIAVNTSFFNFSKSIYNSLNKNQDVNLYESDYYAHKVLKTSLIRGLDIGKNYFAQINPRRKKLLTTLINSYLKALKSQDEINEFSIALDLFYKGMSNGKKFIDLEDKELDFSTGTFWHLNSLFNLERFATSYCRFEYMDYPSIIDQFNSIPKNQTNKLKFIFTLHPNMPNSTKQTTVMYEVIKAIEENDLEYLDIAMMKYIEVNKNRVFEKPGIFDEYYANFSKCLPNMIEAIGLAYESGLKNLSNFYEIPGVYVEYAIENPANINSKSEQPHFPYKIKRPLYEFNLGYISYAHCQNMKLTLNHYLEILSEVNIQENADTENLIKEINLIKNYANDVKNLFLEMNNDKIDEKTFLERYPKFDIEQSESRLSELFNRLEHNTQKDNKISAIAKKLKEIFRIFRSKGTTFQVIIPSFDFDNIDNINEDYDQIFNEIKLINDNGNIIDMIILKDYSSLHQYENVKQLVNKYQIKGDIEIIPRIDNFSNTNDTDSKITVIASSDTRKNDGLLLTELRILRESKNNPEKYIFLGQGTTAERGGGPYKLIHKKYKSLVKMLRERHIRTVQGFYFTAEFLSKDLAFTFLLNGTLRVNQGEHFNPPNDYMDFLFELDSIVGVPQREMQKSEEWNDLYVKNHLIKTLVELYNYSGAKDTEKPLENVKVENAIVQAYINSDRCSFMHPEFAYWDRLTDNLRKKIIKYYYDNNRHFKYILFVYAFMIRRFDLEFAIREVGIDVNNKYFHDIVKGRKALEEILIKLGIGPNSTPVNGIYNQHLGLLEDSSTEEVKQKENAFRMAFVLQNYQVKKFLREKKIGLDSSESEYKIKILQSALSNISQFNGKG